jgi:hypothetical protein
MVGLVIMGCSRLIVVILSLLLKGDGIGAKRSSGLT